MTVTDTSLSDQPILYWLIAHKGLIILGWLALFFLAERLAPAAPLPPEVRKADGRFGWRRLARNGALVVVNAGLSRLVVIPVSVFAATAGPDWRGDTLPFWASLVIDLVILDLFLYWWHRLNHEVPVLWRFHEVHHLDHRLDSTSAVRFHFGEVLLSACARGLVVWALDVSLVAVLLFEILVLVAAIFQHSNLRLPAWLEAPMTWVVVTPRHHWMHHHAVRRDTDSNYATVLTLWDRLFGSFNRGPRLPDMPIGVEGRAELPIWRLLVRPFTRPP